MIHATTIADLRAFQASVGEHQTVFVPTMGALHEGHAALIRAAVAHAREQGLKGGCLVSIFVNPTQFNEQADFERYPRTLDADLSLCRSAGASCIWSPDVLHIYPHGRTIETPPLPRVATNPGLEDACRPGHFEGVCQVVSRLFTLADPAAACFGEKDWQQLQVIRAMSQMMHPGVSILPVPTLREPDGLAMSSRNRFLKPEDRTRALALSRALCECQAARILADAEVVMRRVLGEAGIEPEYAVVREATSLEPGYGEQRALIAARVGSVRLIDNAPWSPRRG